MGLSSIVVVSLAVILNSIELGSQFDRLPNGAPIPNDPRCHSPFSPDSASFPERPRSRSSSPKHSPYELSRIGFHPPEPDLSMYHQTRFPMLPESKVHPTAYSDPKFPQPGYNPGRFPPPECDSPRFSASRPPYADKPSSSSHHSSTGDLQLAKAPAATRIDFPPTKLPSFDGRGCGLEYFDLIRLTSRLNPQRVFKLQRYTFPAMTRIKLRRKDNIYVGVPTGEQIFISTSDNDAFAILESANVLAGMYIQSDGRKKRIKINTGSNEMSVMTKEEMNETPVGRTNPIRTFFKVDQLRHVSTAFL